MYKVYEVPGFDCSRIVRRFLMAAPGSSTPLAGQQPAESLASSLAYLADSLNEYSSALPASPLEASRLKLAELQKKSKSLSASLQRHEQIMHTLSDDTAAVEAQAADHVKKRLNSPVFSKYTSAASPSVGSFAISSATSPLRTTPGAASTYNSPQISTQSSSVSRSVDVAVALAKDMADKRAEVDNLQHSLSLRDVELQVSNAELSRLRAGESKYKDQVAFLSSTVLELKAQINSQEQANAKILRQHQASENEAGILRDELSTVRRSLTGEKIEREALSRRVISLNDQLSALQKDLEVCTKYREDQQKDRQKEQNEYLLVQQTLQAELDQLTRELHTSSNQASQLRKKALAFRLRAEESEVALHNVQQLHKATLEQLADVRGRLKKEQEARWAAETEAARLRGMID